MKIFIIKLLIISLIIFSLGSCNDAIFYKITVEPPLVDPIIGGSPTNFVVFNGKLFIASGKNIFFYDNNVWSKWLTIDYFVINLAVAGDSLYTLYIDSSSGKIGRYDNSGNFIEDVNLSGNVQSIHALDNILFASVRNSNNTYNIYFRKDGSTDFTEIPLRISETVPFIYMLKGVASDSTYYYLCTKYGIFYVNKSQIDTTTSDLPVLGANQDFTGIINLNADCAAAITEKGDLYEIYNAVITDKIVGFDDGRYSTGALALWYRNNTDTTPSLLLVGRNEDYYSTVSAYKNGYLEIELDTSTGLIMGGATFYEPGRRSELTSVDDYDRYTPSLGKKLINYIIQTPAAIDPNMTMFASTQQNGLWSYKMRDGIMIWNAEE